MSQSPQEIMEEKIVKLGELLEEEHFVSSTGERSDDDKIPRVFCSILECLSERLGNIEDQLKSLSDRA